KEVRKYGGRIHAIYVATELKENDPQQMRKPGLGMARRAKKDFPEIDFGKSIIVGDSASDMEFGRNAGMYTVFAGDVHKLSDAQMLQVDVFCDSLAAFAALV
ncbi:MAG TPA: HAD hydrolase-like protein, partial [Chitinophagales bacterium]|nr:HAD hydrolase-like protein [Chitinophagales bacterium]